MTADLGSDRVLRWAAAGLLAVLSVADVAVTRVALGMGATETNPIAASFVETPWAWLLKGGAVLAVGVAMVYLVDSAWIVRFFYGVTALYGAVVVFNTSQVVMFRCLG